MVPVCRAARPPNPETNHERTLSVPYVFRNHLIWGEQVEHRSKRELNVHAPATDGGTGSAQRGVVGASASVFAGAMSPAKMCRGRIGFIGKIFTNKADAAVRFCCA